MEKIGHFGTPAFIAAGAALLLLILHLAVPFGMQDFSKEFNDAGRDDETMSASAVQDQYDFSASYGLASPSIILTGAILALVGGVLVVIGGFLPVPVAPARIIGWTAPLLGMIGAWMSLAGSLYWWGVGFTTLLGVISGNPVEAGYRMWAISPVLTGLLAGLAVFAFFRIMTGVVTTRDGLRDQAKSGSWVIGFSIVLLFGAVVMPWSMEVTSGDDRRTQGECLPSEACEATVAWWSAYGDGVPANNEFVADFGGILELADSTNDLEEQALFQGLATSIKILTATAWVGFFAAVLATFGPLLSSMLNTQAPARIFQWLPLVNVIMLALAVIFTILAASYQWKPNWGDEARFGNELIKDQGWWPSPWAFLVVIPTLALWGMRAVRDMMDFMEGFSARIPKVAEGNAHTFD